VLAVDAGLAFRVIRGNLPSFPSSILAGPLDPQPRTKDDDEEDGDDENETRG
jgi:hypothetical protein